VINQLDKKDKKQKKNLKKKAADEETECLVPPALDRWRGPAEEAGSSAACPRGAALRPPAIKPPAADKAASRR